MIGIHLYRSSYSCCFPSVFLGICLLGPYIPRIFLPCSWVVPYWGSPVKSLPMIASGRRCKPCPLPFHSCINEEGRGTASGFPGSLKGLRQLVVSLNIKTHTHIYIYVNPYIYIHMHIYVYIYIHVYIFRNHIMICKLGL